MKAAFFSASAAVLLWAGSAAPVLAQVCSWGTPGYRDCVEDKIRRLRESEAQGRRPDAAPVAPPERRAPSRPALPGRDAEPSPPPVREWRVGPPSDHQFRIEADRGRTLIAREPRPVPELRRLELQMQSLPPPDGPLSTMERNARAFEIDQLRRQARDRELFADPPSVGGPPLR